MPGAPGGSGGPAGPAGANGKDGAQGDKGPEGQQGLQGKQGEPGPEGEKGEEGSPWTAGGTLPSGETETGIWAFGWLAVMRVSVVYGSFGSSQLTGMGGCEN